MMSKLLRVLPLLLMVGIAFGGGIVENTNQSAEFHRMLARNASTDLDAVFFNPAGLTKLDNGFHLYLSNQTITQGRTITSDLPTLHGDTYEGTTFAPAFPNLYLAYKMDKLVFSAGFVPVGGGGSAVFEDGLPSFEAPVSGIPASLSAAGIPTTNYSFDVDFDGSSIYMGGQASVSYAINDMISLSAGVRYFQASNSYKGYIKDIMINPTYPGVADGSMTSATAFFTTMAGALTAGAAQATGGAASLQPLIDGGAGSVSFANLVLAGQLPQANVDAIAAGLTALGVPGFDAATWTPAVAQGAYTSAAAALTANATAMSANAAATADVEVDAEQTGSGFAPIVGLNISLMDKLNIGIRYEMMAPLVLTNETVVDGSGLFPDGAETNADMPALLGIGLSYLVMPSLNIAMDYNMYFNTDANWDGKEAYVDNGSEIAVGVEFALSKSILLSGGYLMATSGATEAYQSDLSYSLNSNTIGAGLKYTLNPQMAISLAFSTTMYEEGSKSGITYMPGLVGNETYMKDATSFAIGLQKSF
jgi:long-chain fatty acid transport protein